METSILLDELFEEILSWLSVKDLLRLRCVSKSWCALIDDSRFIKKQHQSRYASLKANGDVPLILGKDGSSRYRFDERRPSQFYLLYKERGDDVLLELTNDLHRDGQHVFTICPDAFRTLQCQGVVNGILCLEWGVKTRSLALWNPATREFKVVAPWHNFEGGGITARIMGFGFDPVSSDFKIVGFRDSYTEGMVYEMYSLSTNSWKSLKESPTIVLGLRFARNVYLNGVCYWIGWELEGEQRFVILSFDFHYEVFKVSYLPPDAIGDSYTIGIYMESPAMLICSYDYKEAMCCVNVWVEMKFDDGDHGVPSSWQHVCTIRPLPGLVYQAYTFRMDGDLLLANLKGECKFYNPLTRTFKKVATTFNFCSGYVETLFPLSNKLV